jgi:aminoglycoside phosphotransferase (APT) family kinase protein
MIPSRAGPLWTGHRVTGSPEHRLTPEVMGALVREIADRLGEELQVADQLRSLTGCQTIWVEGRRPYVVKLALGDAASPRLESNASALAAVARFTATDASLSSVIPKIVHSGRLGGLFYSVEGALPGVNASGYLTPRRDSDWVAEQALRFLVRLHAASRDDHVLELATWNRHFQPVIDAVAAFAKRHDPTGGCERIGRYLRDQLVDQSVPMVFAHGNFWIGNLLVDSAQGLTGVIDWDSAVERGLPMVDLLYLLVRTESLIEGGSLGGAVAKWIASDLQGVAVHPLVEEYCREFSIPATWLRPLFLYCWIQHLSSHVRYRTAALEKPIWLRENLLNVLSQVRLSERHPR